MAREFDRGSIRNNIPLRRVVRVRSVLRSASFFLGALLLLVFPAMASEGVPEHQIKAEMMLRMGEFVDWPDGTFSSPEDPFVIGVAGENSFGSVLEDLSRTEKIHDRRVIVQPWHLGESTKSCHLLFIPRAIQTKITRIIGQLSGSPVLLIGDTEAICRKGAHIGFQVSEGRVQFLINLDSARRCRLKINSKLLRLATRIISETE